jgi:hypothetical protein
MIPRFRRAVCGSFGIATWKSSRGDKPERGLFQARILKDRAERSASAVRERVRPALAIVAMKPRMAMDCIAWARMPTVAWFMPVAVQNKITRFCALSSVVGFAMAYSVRLSRMPPSRPRGSLRSRASACPLCGGGRRWRLRGLGGGDFGGFGGNMNKLPDYGYPGSGVRI